MKELESTKAKPESAGEEQKNLAGKAEAGGGWKTTAGEKQEKVMAWVGSTLGERLQWFRKRFGYSQGELGGQLCVDAKIVSNWEKDKTVPDIDNLKKMSNLYKVSVDQLIGLEEGEPPSAGVLEECREKWKKDVVLRKLVLRLALAAVVITSTAIPPFGLIMCVSTLLLSRKWELDIKWLNVVILLCFLADVHGIWMLLNMFVFDFGYSEVTPL